MCGILGIYDKAISIKQLDDVKKGLDKQKRRGPDQSGIFHNQRVVLAHSRLSIIDTSLQGQQPITDSTQNYHIVYNGEFYNYKEEKEILIEKGYCFKTDTDTEVLLYMYILYGVDFLKKINGCFALAIYDSKKNNLFLARDRFGIKPLYYTQENGSLKFASEIKGILPLLDKKELDKESLYLYFNNNYIPGLQSIIKGVRQLKPACFMQISNRDVTIKAYHQISYDKNNYSSLSYEEAQKKVRYLLEDSVQKRLVADVSLGTFLSGGVDSSIVSYLAKKHLDNLSTFSIGYSDEPFFDETQYAEKIAKKIGSHHHSFSLSNDDLYQYLFDILNYIDEPFADSSAIPVYILSKLTRQHVTVALSGDGADELFSGYNKHQAHYDMLNWGIKEQLVKRFGKIATVLPQSRTGKWSNKTRQVVKYYKGIALSDKERYWQWAGIDNGKINNLLKIDVNQSIIQERKDSLLQYIDKDFNTILLSDIKMVLPNDMLYKVDRMSMANGLEVRTPFLDHRLVDFLFTLPSHYKINKGFKKKLLQDSFKDFLSPEIYRRSKHGFEVPLQKWFRNALYSYIFDDLLNIQKIEEQGVLNVDTIKYYRTQLQTAYSGDSTATIWALIVFQHWYDRFLNDNI